MPIDADRLRAIADRARQIAAPLRTVTVTIRKSTWSGTQVGEGTETFTQIVLPRYVKVRELSGKEIASSGGRFEDESAVADLPSTTCCPRPTPIARR
jgi:hypothetical protein